MPDLYIIGGPNGAGKTTTALRVFPRLGVRAFINADIIAHGISPLDVESAARAAGRIMLSEMERHLKSADDFALETTLASRSLAPFVRRCQDAGYRFILIYVWLESADLAIERVARRVKAGGHNIPEDVIRRRYERGRENFFGLYRELADEWSVVDNSNSIAVKIARYEDGETEISQPDIWQIISQERFMKTLDTPSKLDIVFEEMKEAVADAIETHRRMGRSIVVSENGQIKHIKPKDILPRALPHDEWEND